MDKPGLVHESGKTMSLEQAQEAIRRTYELKGRFILSSLIEPRVGEVQLFAGLPMRVVRLVTLETAQANQAPGIWGTYDELDPSDFHFEVVVAD